VQVLLSQVGAAGLAVISENPAYNQRYSSS